MTTRSLLASLVCSLALIACGDDGSNNPGDDSGDDGNELCGNGTLEGSEACDDRNSDTDDGCTNCTIDEGYNCQGEPSVCIMGEFPVIFDGSCTGPLDVELVDDGFGGLEGHAVGDTTTGTNHAPEATCNGDTVGGGNDLTFKFTLVALSDVYISGDVTEHDVALRVSRVACDVAMQVEDDGGDGCADYYPGEDYEEMLFTALPAGTYYLTVDGHDATENGAFDIGIYVAPSTCGDGVVDTSEDCDDGDNDDADGCDSTCVVEDGYVCDGEPSLCELACGNGVVDSFEECDDGGDVGTDGCSATCQIEPGYACTDAEPSVCANTCGNGTIQPGEECDDNDADNLDGCSDNCRVEDGFLCTGTPSLCESSLCQNGDRDAGEECDDDNGAAGDGCSATCSLEFDVLEVESNDTAPQAITLTLVNDDAHVRVKGDLTAANVDLYQFTLAAPAVVSLETYNTSNGIDDYLGAGDIEYIDCLGGLDTEIFLFAQGADYTDDTDALASDDDDGDLSCSYVGPNTGDATSLAAGTYVVRVTAGAAAPVYILDITVNGGTTTSAGGLVINEVFIDPGAAADTNCDGTFSNVNDEFVELVNSSNATIDLTGMTLSDNFGVRHTFAATGTPGHMNLLAGESVVIWSGGTPNCPGVTNWFKASTGALGLNNGITAANPEVITVRSGTTVVATATFTAHTQGVSKNHTPDITGTAYANHDTVPGAATRKFSPGKKVDGTAFLP